MMRIRDSEDYLTARGANPRTGQISPSVRSSPATPDNPGAALKNYAPARSSPTPTKRHADLARQANEGKRVKDRVEPAWLAGAGAFRDTSCNDLVLPSMIIGRQPRQACSKPVEVHEDAFVVKMPSAREPQPYTYPGSDANEIQAFEHYKRKTKRTSGDGYDKRLLVDGKVLPDKIVTEQRVTQPVRPQQHHFEDNVEIAPLNVIKRRPVSNSQSIDNTAQQAYAEQSTADPYRQTSSESVQTVLHQRHATTPATRMPSTESATTATGFSHLNQLPRVRLVHPSLASTPPVQPYARACSLDCPRNPSTGACIESRKSSAQSNAGATLFEHPESRKTSMQSSAQPSTESQLFERPGSRKTSLQSVAEKLTLYQEYTGSKRPQPSDPVLEIMEIIMLAASISWRSFKDFVIAHTGTISRLFPRDLTTWEKLMIVRSVFCLLVRITAVSIVVALTWKLTGIVLQVLKLVFWPLDIIIRAGRWMVVTV